MVKKADVETGAALVSDAVGAIMYGTPRFKTVQERIAFCLGVSANVYFSFVQMSMEFGCPKDSAIDAMKQAHEKLLEAAAKYDPHEDCPLDDADESNPQ